MPGARFSFSPRILPSFMSSTSVTAFAPPFTTWKVAGPAVIVAGVAVHPASAIVIVTVTGPDPEPLPGASEPGAVVAPP